jgi:hypothetical protein
LEREARRARKETIGFACFARFAFLTGSFDRGETMTIDAWLQGAIADAERRGLPELKPILETLARATRALRAADFNDDASGSQQSAVSSPQSALS